jgi:hypothetical protein
MALHMLSGYWVSLELTQYRFLPSLDTLAFSLQTGSTGRPHVR